jgi:hypothetical protein
MGAAKVSGLSEEPRREESVYEQNTERGLEVLKDTGRADLAAPIVGRLMLRPEACRSFRSNNVLSSQPNSFEI